MARPNTDTRWTWIFATVLILVVLVVIGFLTGIVSALDSIDGGLKEANAQVTGIKGDAAPLPAHIDDINNNLTKIDKALKPIPVQGKQILTALTSVNSSLTQVNGSLGSTSASLVDTGGSLVDTSGLLTDIAGSVSATSSSLVDTSASLRDTSSSLVDTTGSLVSTRGVAVNIAKSLTKINSGLSNAQRISSLGTAEIPIRANKIAVGLEAVIGDANNIITGLKGVNRHLTSICNSAVLTNPLLPVLLAPFVAASSSC